MSLLTEYQNMLFCFNKVSMINSYGVSADAHTHTNKKKTWIYNLEYFFLSKGKERMWFINLFINQITMLNKWKWPFSKHKFYKCILIKTTYGNVSFLYPVDINKKIDYVIYNKNTFSKRFI